MKIKIIECAQIGGARVQCVNNQFTKLECKGVRSFRVIDYTNYASQKCCRRADGLDPLLDGDEGNRWSDYINHMINECAALLFVSKMCDFLFLPPQYLYIGERKSAISENIWHLLESYQHHNL